MTDPALAEQIRALAASSADTPDRRAVRRRVDEDAPRAPPTRQRAAGQQPATATTWSTRSAADLLRLRPLDTARPGNYKNWRLATKAAVACRADDQDLMAYVAAIEDSSIDEERMMAAVGTSATLRAVDKLLYSAILECLEGDKRDDFVDEIRTSVMFGRGCMALRVLGRKLGQGGERAKAPATAELLGLAPAGKSAAG